MSWWVYRRSADGRHEVWQIDIDLTSIAFVLGLLVVFVVPRWMRGEQTLGVVDNIDKTSRQLKEALESGKTLSDL